jgi:hypothetical protein
MDAQWDVASNNEALLIDQGHHTTTNWSKRMWEREEGDDMQVEGIRMEMAVKAMRWVGWGVNRGGCWGNRGWGAPLEDDTTMTMSAS